MKAVKATVMDYLKADKDLYGLMGSPEAVHQNIFYLDPPSPPVFPEVVVDYTSYEFDNTFDRYLLATLGDLSVNIWTKDGTFEDIADRLLYLLHHRTIGAGLVAIASRAPQELLDRDMNAYGKNLLFNLFTRRTII